MSPYRDAPKTWYRCWSAPDTMAVEIQDDWDFGIPQNRGLH